jgi:zinc/manganese transport system substrate-binding protein
MTNMPNTSKKTNTNNRRIALVFAIILVAVGAAVALLQLNKTPGFMVNKVQVVAAENFWGNILSQIGGKNVEVTSVISDPGADPHLYESDANDAARLAHADIVVTNGLGYDDFMDKLLSASGNDSRQVLSVADILKANGQSANPHLWYDIPRIREVAAAFEAALEKKDPANAKTYAVNLTSFNMSLQPLLDTLYTIRTAHPGTPVAYTERVPEYLLSAAGLTVKTPAGFSSAIEEGNDPSPADTTALETLITKRQIKALLYNAQATSSVTEHIKELAKQSGIPVIGVTETMPAGAGSYQAWQLAQAKALLKALESK